MPEERATTAGALWRATPYTGELLPEMTDLWVEAWTAAMPEIDFDARRGWFVNHMRAMTAIGTDVHVLRDPHSGAMAGFVTFDAQRNWLDQLVVSIWHQGSGAARALLDAVRARSTAVIRLDVNAENARACAFYVREGFVETGRGTNSTSGRATIQMEWRRS